MLAPGLHYLLTRLPSLPDEPVGVPPLSADEFAAIVATDASGAVQRVLDLLLLERRIEAALPRRLGYAVVSPRGGVDADDDDVAAVARARPQLGLLDAATTSSLGARVPDWPDPIRAAWDADVTVVGEVMWAEQVFDAVEQYNVNEATAIGSSLLRRYVEFDHALRCALAVRRGETARAGASASGEVHDLVEAWRAAPDPLQGERVLDAGRWQFVAGLAPRYTAHLDEFVGYYLRLRLLWRAHAIATGNGQQILDEVTAL